MEALPDRAPRIVWCPSCGTGLTEPPPGRDVTSSDLFEESGLYPERLKDRPQWSYEAKARLKWLERERPSLGRILEIGSATGEFVALAQSAGYRAEGIEASQWAVEHSRDITPDVTFGMLDSVLARGGRHAFDTIAAFHVLEHVGEADEFLAEVRECLAPGGTLFIEVPNSSVRAAHPDGTDWWMASLEDHFFHYTQAGLVQLVRRSGFEVCEVNTMPVSIYNRPFGIKGRLSAIAGRIPGRAEPELLRLSAKERTGG